MKIKLWLSRKGSRVMDEVEVTLRGDIPQFPHCDALILHAPGSCEFCDRHPDWQALRSAQGVAFSDTPYLHVVADNLIPCPSVYRRSAGDRDLWEGNHPRPTGRNEP